MYNNSENRASMRLSVMMMIAVAITTMQLSSMLVLNNNSSFTNNVYAKYSGNSQAQSFVNECGIGGSSGNNCQNTGPQTIADGAANALAPLQISSSGEQGPPGPQGPAGPPGPQGPAGQNGTKQQLQVRTVIGNQTIVPANATRQAFAFCAPGELATGGGYFEDQPGSNSLNSSPSDSGQPGGSPNSWSLILFNPGPGNVGITSFAECAKLVDAP